MKSCICPLCAQVVKMWSWVFTVAVLLSSMKQAEAQGISNSQFSSCVSLYTESFYALTCVLHHLYLQAGVTMCKQQILFFWSTGPPVLAELTSCR